MRLAVEHVVEGPTEELHGGDLEVAYAPPRRPGLARPVKLQQREGMTV